MIFYILVDNNDYMNNEFLPIAEYYDTKEEALFSLFDDCEKEDYYDENDNTFEDKSDSEYLTTRLKEYTYGDGESVKLIFEVNTDAKTVTWVQE
jgi:hypothetical protein